MKKLSFVTRDHLGREGFICYSGWLDIVSTIDLLGVCPLQQHQQSALPTTLWLGLLLEVRPVACFWASHRFPAPLFAPISLLSPHPLGYPRHQLLNIKAWYLSGLWICLRFTRNYLRRRLASGLCTAKWRQECRQAK